MTQDETRRAVNDVNNRHTNIQISGERDEIHAKLSSAIIEIHNFREENYSHERGISEIANDVHSTSHILDFQPCIEIEMAHLRGSNSPQGICSRFPDPRGMKKCIPILQAKFYYIPPLEGRFQTFWGIDI